MIPTLRSVARFGFFGAYSLYTVVKYFALRLIGRSQADAARKIRHDWLRRVPRAVGLRIEKEGEPFEGTCLYVGNHISSADPVLALSFFDANVVAKAEVRKYPVIGFGAALVGTIYVNREERESRNRTANAIGDALSNGTSILIYPEGTTTAGPTTIPFRPRAFEAAERAGAPVQPIAHFYETPKAAYVGDMTFLGHFFELFKLPVIYAYVSFGPVLRGTDTCDRARAWIDQRMLAYHAQYRDHAAH